MHYSLLHPFPFEDLELTTKKLREEKKNLKEEITDLKLQEIKKMQKKDSMSEKTKKLEFIIKNTQEEKKNLTRELQIIQHIKQNECYVTIKNIKAKNNDYKQELQKTSRRPSRKIK